MRQILFFVLASCAVAFAATTATCSLVVKPTRAARSVTAR